MEEKMEFVFVTGMSGAGKTSAMAVFENLEYQCIDNCPIELFNELGELFRDTARYTKVAMAVSLNDAIQAIRTFINLDWIHLTIVFLDADDEALLSRYKQTRRSHPLLISNKAASLQEAIEFERKIAQPIEQLANISIDTGHLRPNAFQTLLERYFIKGGKEPFRVTFESFGYKHGIPKDADILLDVRFLPNPFYIEELRDYTGNDKYLYDWVMEKEETQTFIQVMTKTLDYLLDQFDQEGRMHAVIGIGCTGGQHRSVTLTNYFASYYSNKYPVHKLHRDANH